MVLAAVLTEGGFTALLCVQAPAARNWQEIEVEALCGVAARVWPVVERIRAKHALLVSEERLKLATQSTGVGVFDYDVVADRSYWSPELCAIRGVPPGTRPRFAEVLATIHEDDRARFAAAVSAAVDPRGSGVVADEFRAHRWDTGETRWVTNSFQTFFEGAGSSRRAVRIAGIVSDITERKRREAHDTFLSELGAAWISARDEPTLVRVTAEAIRRHLDVNRVTLVDIARDACVGVDDVLTETARIDVASGRSVVIGDVATDLRTA